MQNNRKSKQTNVSGKKIDQLHTTVAQKWLQSLNIL